MVLPVSDEVCGALLASQWLQLESDRLLTGSRLLSTCEELILSPLLQKVYHQTLQLGTCRALHITSLHLCSFQREEENSGPPQYHPSLFRVREDTSSCCGVRVVIGYVAGGLSRFLPQSVPVISRKEKKTRDHSTPCHAIDRQSTSQFPTTSHLILHVQRTQEHARLCPGSPHQAWYKHYAPCCYSCCRPFKGQKQATTWPLKDSTPSGFVHWIGSWDMCQRQVILLTNSKELAIIKSPETKDMAIWGKKISISLLSDFQWNPLKR